HALWRALGESGDILDQQWPAVDENALSRDSVEMVVQVKGKVRGKVSVSADADHAAITEAALAEGNVSRFVEELGDYAVKIVPGKLISIFPRKK
ncbi:MAG: leucine--tRNA ligase, partial [Halieaceae bacterium]|nr:leucine--tRNA ligase [Halieaceae bacterium]